MVSCVDREWSQIRRRSAGKRTSKTARYYPGFLQNKLHIFQIQQTLLLFSWTTKLSWTFWNVLSLAVLSQKRLRWPRGERADLWYPSSRVQTRSKPSDFSGEKFLSAPSFGEEVKPSVTCRKFSACKRTQKWRGSVVATFANSVLSTEKCYALPICP